MKKNYSILVVDDEVEMRIALSATLKRCNFDVHLSHNAKDAMNKISANEYDLILSDMTMPKKSGVELLKEIKNFDANLPVIIMTAHGTIETAVKCMKLGAFDYILKPFDFDTVVFLIERALNSKYQNNHQTPVANHKQNLPALTKSEYKHIITNNQKMKELLDMAKSIANGRSTIFIEAESGTGKELLAKYIHDCSDRKDKPFIAINCAALPESLLESELFGHKKGAFTGAINDHKGKFEQAQHGTILLDEITEMELTLQAKLLRVLQEFKIDRVGGSEPITIDVRVIATSNRPVMDYVNEGKFREDLYFRLNVIPLHLPPLRDRKDDIIPLAEYFVKKHAELNNLEQARISKDAIKVLQSYHWRGNVRELENVIERATLFSANSKQILPKHLLLSDISRNSKSKNKKNLKDTATI